MSNYKNKFKTKAKNEKIQIIISHLSDKTHLTIPLENHIYQVVKKSYSIDNQRNLTAHW